MQRSRIAWLVLSMAAIGACRPAAPALDDARARAHIDMLAGTIGSRPTGSEANVRARAYLVDQLRQMGFDVRVQEMMGVDVAQGVSAPVANIIASHDGEVREAIALLAHYDSVPEAMGAQDDGIGVATSLESARELMKNPLRHSLFVIMTDGEELGLLGARAAVLDPEISSRVRAFLNFDGTGASGRALLFEAGPGRGAPLEAWARGAASPEGASFTTEIYKRLPNDTDFSVFKTLPAVSGVNFAPVGDSYSYHTDRDVAAVVSSATLRHEIGNTVTLVRTLDAGALSAVPADAATYIDLLGISAIVYGPVTSRTIAILAIVSGVIAWLVFTRELWRLHRVRGMLMTIAWAIVTATATVGSMISAVAALRAVRPEVAPWYAEPQRFFVFVIATGGLAVWIATRLASHARPRLRPWRHPLATWWLILPCWIALAIGLHRSASTAAYMVTLPLLSAGVLTLLCRGRVTWLRGASLVTLVVVGVCALDDIARLSTFLVPLLGWLPIITPVWLYPAVFAIAALLGAPPLLAAVAGLTSRVISPSRIGVMLAVLVVAGAAQAIRAPAYTSERPERRVARYVQDDLLGQAWWEVGGVETAIGLQGAGGPDGARWSRVTDAPPANGAITRMNLPAVYRTSSPPAATVPADVHTAASRRDPTHLDIEVSVIPHENLAVRIVLPRGVVPSGSTIVGRVSGGHWIATIISPPSSGLTTTLTFDHWTSLEPPQIIVTLTTVGMPGGEGRLRLPLWLPQDTMTWRARSVFVVAPK